MGKAKEMLLRMIIRCNKSKSHKPKEVKNPVLEAGGKPSVEFPEDLTTYKTREETKEVREKLRKLV